MRLLVRGANLRVRNARFTSPTSLAERQSTTTSLLYKGNGVLGIVREQYGMWERRAPLSPDQVRSLIEAHNFRVIVQPSSLRIFSNDDYVKAGATVAEDLSEACLILGIKKMSLKSIQPGKSYMFFGHVIKAQKSNFDILDKLLLSKARLFDYECITAEGKNDRPRLVAFGKFAGMAGMIDGLQGLGLKLLAEGLSTPFLNVPMAYMHGDLASARLSLAAMGQQIAAGGVPKASSAEPSAEHSHTQNQNQNLGMNRGLNGNTSGDQILHTGGGKDSPRAPFKSTPSCLVVAFTGSGNVTKGARDMFELLPHEYVTPHELPRLREQVESGVRSGNKVYGVCVTLNELVKLKNPDPKTTTLCLNQESTTHDSSIPVQINKSHYYANPDQYEPIFHDTIAPYVTMIVNGVYWDFRYPRILSKTQLQTLRNGGNYNLKVIADVSCDVKGSFEFLSHTTSIEKPFFTYMSESDCAVDGVQRDGVTMLGVDILPSELPKDASEHFGTALSPLLPPLLRSLGALSPDMLSDLPPELRRACIASHGRLGDRWSYIARLRSLQTAPQGPGSGPGGSLGIAATFDDVIMELEMRGHLFDSGLINKVLDHLEDTARPTSSDGMPRKVLGPSAVEDKEAVPPIFTFNIVNCDVRANTAVSPTPSVVVIRLTGPRDTVQAVSESVALLGRTHQGAFAYTKITTKAKVQPPKRVLLFGSGRVAKPLMRLLGQHDNVHITVATDSEEQALDIMGCMGQPSEENAAVRCSFQPFRFPDDNHMLPDMLSSCDIAVSLLPATMHIPIAKEAIIQGKHFVTASYVGEEMRTLDRAARERGVILLNEVGLDPGIDHMLIMKAVNSIQSRGGRVVELVSLCGGLPDPVAADNPLKYKISWSPRGVLSAATNSATYLKDGQTVHVCGAALLKSVLPCERFPTMRMEVLPNRDSLVYRSLYGVTDVTTICRGTLRYYGWADVMQSLKALNLLSDQKFDTNSIRTWTDLLEDGMSRIQNPTPTDPKKAGSPSRRDRIRTLLSLPVCGVRDVEGAVDALEWLGLPVGTAHTDTVTTTVDASHRHHPTHTTHTSHSTTTSTTYSSESAFNISGDSPIDALSAAMAAHSGLSYQKGERDMVAMYHTVVGEMADGSVERHTSRLMAFGSPTGGGRGAEKGEREGEDGKEGDSAMSATVGYTTAAAVELLLQLGPVTRKGTNGGTTGVGVGGSGPLGGRAGVMIPITADLYEPILNRLNDFGITWTESVNVTQKNNAKK